MKPIVVYTDPFWALANGEVNPGLATIERETFGDKVDLRFGVVENGVYVKSGDRFEVSTHTMALVLALERHVCLQNDHLKKGHWDIYGGGYPRRLQGLTVGIVGLGRIGKATARKIQNFYGRVIGYDPYVHGDQMIGYGVAKRHTLPDLLHEADVVILHCLLTDETKNLVGASFLDDMKDDALLVNTARGGLVEPKAVHDALAGGRIGGYASDVFTPEDPNDHEWNSRLLPFENVIVTSHRAFLSAESEHSQRRRVAEEILYVLETGRPPRWGSLTE